VSEAVALVACYNEEEKIADTVKSLMEIGLEVVVVDDCSIDNSAKKADEAGARVLVLNENIGKGAAIRTALASINASIVLFLDGDLGSSAKEAKKILEPVEKNQADVSIAVFPKPEIKGGFGLAKGLARWGIKRFTGLEMAAPLSGQRAIRKEVLDKVVIEDGFGLETGLTIDTVRAGFRIVEVKTNMAHSATGRNIPGFIHRGKQFIAIAKVIIKRVGR